MLCAIKAGLCQFVLDKKFVGKGFLRSAAFGHQYKKTFRKRGRGNKRRCVIGINIRNKFRVKFLFATAGGPIFQGKVQGAGAKVRTANAYLYHRAERLAGTALVCTAVNGGGKIAKAVKFRAVKVADVLAVFDYRLSLPAPQKLMQHLATLTGVHHFAI